MSRTNNAWIILKSVLIGYLITLFLIFVYSFFLANTDLPEKTIPACVLIFSILGVFIASSTACIKIGEKGIKNGGVIGCIYVVLIYLIGSLISKNFAIDTYDIATFVINIVLRNDRWDYRR